MPLKRFLSRPSWSLRARQLAALACVLAAPRAAAQCMTRVPSREALVFRADPGAQAIPIARFSAYRWDGTRFSPVPLQIDEKNRNGDYVLENGLPYTARTDDGLLDDNDELVVKGESLGEPFTRENVDAFLGAAGGEAWQLRFCQGEHWHGNLLLVASESRSAPYFGAAVDFSPAAKSLVTPTYRYKFRDANPILLGDVWVNRDGKERKLFADSWFRIMFKLPWWLPDFNLTDENFTSEIECWRVGPVRAIVAVGVKLRKFLSIFNFHMFSELVFYPNRFEIPTVLEFPASPRSFFKPGSGLVYHVTFPPGETWDVDARLLNVEDPAFTSSLKPRPAQGKPYVVSLAGPWGRLGLQVALGSNNGQALPEPLLVKRTVADLKENLRHFNWLKENPGDLGVFTDISQIDKGRYHFSLDLRLAFEADQSSYVEFDKPSVGWEALSQHRSPNP